MITYQIEYYSDSFNRWYCCVETEDFDYVLKEFEYYKTTFPKIQCRLLEVNKRILMR